MKMLGGVLVLAYQSLVVAATQHSGTRKAVTSCSLTNDSTWRIGRPEEIRSFLSSAQPVPSFQNADYENIVEIILEPKLGLLAKIGNPGGKFYQRHSFKKFDGWFYHTEKAVTFIYPDFVTGLEGRKRLVHGSFVMDNAVRVRIKAHRCLDGFMELKMKKIREKVVYKAETDLGVKVTQPLLMDPMEKRFTYLADTEMGHGMFAKIDIEANTLISFYGGVFINKDVFTDNMTVDEIEFRHQNLMSFNHSHLIDVPSPDITVFRATLGHKANHKFMNNAKFNRVYHPRFGHIRGLESLTFIPKGVEIFVNYNYTPYGKRTPRWYNELFEKEGKNTVK